LLAVGRNSFPAPLCQYKDFSTTLSPASFCDGDKLPVDKWRFSVDKPVECASYPRENCCKPIFLLRERLRLVIHRSACVKTVAKPRENCCKTAPTFAHFSLLYQALANFIHRWQEVVGDIVETGVCPDPDGRG
jgi:hypothetical protein